MTNREGASTMIQVEFGIVHEGCLVNELSRSLPEIRFICPGGFVLGPFGRLPGEGAERIAWLVVLSYR